MATIEPYGKGIRFTDDIHECHLGLHRVSDHHTLPFIQPYDLVSGAFTNVREYWMGFDGAESRGHIGILIMPAREMRVPREETTDLYHEGFDPGNPGPNPAILEGFCPYNHGALAVGYLHVLCTESYETRCERPQDCCPKDCANHGDHGKLVGSCEQCGCSWRYDAEEQQIYGVACVPGRHHCGLDYLWGGESRVTRGWETTP